MSFTNLNTVNRPANGIEVLTPDNSTDLPEVPRGIYVSSSGNLNFIDNRGHTETVAVVAGAVLPFRIKRLLSGTTATVAGMF